MAYIRFENICKSFGKNEVLKNINLDVEKGQLVTLLGPSGCGKSTLLRCLAGLETVTSGKVYLDGNDITNVNPKDRDIGMVFQQYSLFPNMTVEQNVAFGLKMKKVDKSKIQTKVRDIVEIVGLGDKMRHYPSQLSGGQQQRAALARAIVTEPKVLLLDEPLSAIDALLRHSLQIEIRRIQKELNITAIFVTHDQDEALTLSDRIAVFNKGKIEQVGTPDELYNKAETEYVCNFIGDVSKLSGEVIRLINEELGETRFHPDAASYIRQERIETDRLSPDAVAMEAKVLEREFYGTHSIYTSGILDSTIKGYVKECGGMPYQPGEVIRVYINPRDILQY